MIARLRSVICKVKGECTPGRVHRLDRDLELCVCEHCGQGWVRDVDPWTKLEELLVKLAESTKKMESSSKKLAESLQGLSDALKR